MRSALRLNLNGLGLGLGYPGLGLGGPGFVYIVSRPNLNDLGLGPSHTYLEKLELIPTSYLDNV